MLSSPLTMATCSSLESTPILRSIVAWAMEPRMSWRHSRQSNETDSVNRATSAPRSPRNLPLRETGELFFMPLFASESVTNTPESHAGKADRKERRCMGMHGSSGCELRRRGRKKGRWRFRATLLSPVPNDLLGYNLKQQVHCQLQEGTEKDNVTGWRAAGILPA